MWSKDSKKKNLCFFVIFFSVPLSPSHALNMSAELDTGLHPPIIWQLEVFFPPNSPFKSFWASRLFPQRVFSGRNDTQTLFLIDSDYILSPASLPLPGFVLKTHRGCSKEILLRADIYQVTTRSGQVFDTQVFACNYQVVLQVAEAQHISRGYEWSSSLTCLSFFPVRFLKRQMEFYS